MTCTSCGHAESIHPCRGAWRINDGRLIRIGRFTFVKILRLCRCTTPTRRDVA